MPSPKVRVAAINFAASGDNIVVPVFASGPISIAGIAFTVHAATNITFKNGSTAQSGAIELTNAGSAMTLPMNDGISWYWADPGNNFIMNSSNAVQVSGTIWYTNG